MLVATALVLSRAPRRRPSSRAARCASPSPPRSPRRTRAPRSAGRRPTNADVAYLTGTGFGYYDDSYALVEDPSFGTAEIVDESPFTVRYTVADGAPGPTASRSMPPTCCWPGPPTRARSTPPASTTRDYVDPATGQYTDDFPDDVVFFDGTIGNGLELRDRDPDASSRIASLEVTYDEYFPNWRLALQPGVAAHVVAEHALGLSDGSGPTRSGNDPTPARLPPIAREGRAGRRRSSGATPASWPTSPGSGTPPTTSPTLPDDPALLVASGPVSGHAAITDNESVTLTANPEYHGDREPSYETIELRVSPDPLETVDLLAQARGRHRRRPQPSEDVVAALVGVDGRDGHGRLGGHVRAPRPAVRRVALGRVRRLAGARGVPARGAAAADPRRPDRARCRRMPACSTRSCCVPARTGTPTRSPRTARASTPRPTSTQPIALLAEAGVDEAAGRASCTTPPTRAGSRSSPLIRTSAARAGFVVTDCSNPDWEGLLGVAGTYDAALFAWDTTRLGPAAASAVFRSDSKLANFNGYSNPEVDGLIDQLDASDDAAEVTQPAHRDRQPTSGRTPTGCRCSPIRR